jgi:hypothetical protein
MNLTEAAAMFAKMATAVREAESAALEKACLVIEDEANRVLGTYDYDWPKLAESTIGRKATGESPLLETNELRDSIEHVVFAEDHHAYVGTNEDRAVFAELGTVNESARSFLAGAAMRKGEEAAHEIASELITRMTSVKG